MTLPDTSRFTVCHLVSAAEPPIGSNAVLPFANIPRARRHRSLRLFVVSGLALLGPFFVFLDSWQNPFLFGRCHTP